MKIRDIRTVCFRQPMIPLHAGNFAGDLELVLTVVEADDGREGYSLARAHGGQPGRTIADPITASLRARALGMDPRQPQPVWDRMAALEPAGYVSVFALAAVDVAIWDLAAKAQDRTVAALCGGRRSSIQPYASSSHYQTIDDYLADLDAAVRAGYTAYKAHPFHDPDRDIDLARALRDAAGAGFRLMLDVAKRYDYDGALRVGEVLQSLDFHWYEEPLPQHDWAGYRRLRQALQIPVIGGETLPGLYPAIGNALAADAYAAVLCDVYWKGGITGCLRTIELCQARGVPVVSHHGASALMNLANLHVLCGATDVEMIEVLFPESPYECGVDRPARIGADGMFHVPDAPGLGARPDWAYIDAHRAD